MIDETEDIVVSIGVYSEEHGNTCAEEQRQISFTINCKEDSKADKDTGIHNKEAANEDRKSVGLKKIFHKFTSGPKVDGIDETEGVVFSNSVGY